MKKITIFCAATLCVAAIATWTLDGRVNAEEKADATEAIVDAYVGSWNEPDEDARRGLLERAWSDDGVYTDPRGEARGRDALIAHTGNFLKNPAMKGFSMERVSGIDKHHNMIRFNWALKNPEGKAVMSGVDFGVLADDGRLESITGFFGPMPESE